MTHTPGPLEWRSLLQWLRDDALVSAEEADATRRRFSGANSAQHPLVRLGAVNLTHTATGKALDVEALTEWLALRCGLPYLRIDPLRVDVGRVTECRGRDLKSRGWVHDRERTARPRRYQPPADQVLA